MCLYIRKLDDLCNRAALSMAAQGNYAHVTLPTALGTGAIGGLALFSLLALIQVSGLTSIPGINTLAHVMGKEGLLKTSWGLVGASAVLFVLDALFIARLRHHLSTQYILFTEDDDKSLLSNGDDYTKQTMSHAKSVIPEHDNYTKKAISAEELKCICNAIVKHWKQHTTGFSVQTPMRPLEKYMPEGQRRKGPVIVVKSPSNTCSYTRPRSNVMFYIRYTVETVVLRDQEEVRAYFSVHKREYDAEHTPWTWNKESPYVVLAKEPLINTHAEPGERLLGPLINTHAEPGERLLGPLINTHAELGERLQSLVKKKKRELKLGH